MYVRQDDVLLVTDTQLIVAEMLGDIGEDAHLFRRGIARRRAVSFQGNCDDRVAGCTGVRPDLCLSMHGRRAKHRGFR